MKSSQSKVIIPTQEVSHCPECGSPGQLKFSDCQDLICKLPGSWSFFDCPSCGSLWLNPRPTDEAIPSLYTSAYHFTHGTPTSPLQEPAGVLAKIKFAIKLGIWMQAFGYENLDQHTSFPLLAQLGRVISFIPGQRQRAGYSIRFLHNREAGQRRLLEVGTGNGSFLWLMHSLGWEVEGLEPDPLAAQSARETGLNIIANTIAEANLELVSYDAIVMHHVLEHLPNHKSVIEKLVLSLKSGGTLVSISPNPSGLLSKIYQENWYALDAPRHLALPSPKGYQKLLEDQNISINIQTTMQIIFWICRESLSIKSTGAIGSSQKSFLPMVVATLGKFLAVFSSSLGEEVICVATKK